MDKVAGLMRGMQKRKGFLITSLPPLCHPESGGSNPPFANYEKKSKDRER